MKKLLASVTVVMALGSSVHAADKVCDGWLKFGHGSNTTVSVIQKLSEDDYVGVCWFNDSASFSKKLYNLCDDAIGLNRANYCRITAVVRGRDSQIISVRSAKVHKYSLVRD